MDPAQDPLVSFYRARGVLSTYTEERAQDELRYTMDRWEAGYTRVRGEPPPIPLGSLWSLAKGCRIATVTDVLWLNPQGPVEGILQALANERNEVERLYDAHIRALSLLAEHRVPASVNPDARSSADEWPPGTRLRATPPPPDRAASKARLTPAPGAAPLAGAVPLPGMAAAGGGVSWPRVRPPGPPPDAAPGVPPDPLWEQSLRRPWNCPQPGPRPRPAWSPGRGGPPRQGPALAPGLPVSACPYGDVRRRDRDHGRPRSPGRAPGLAGKGAPRTTLGRASSRRPSSPPGKAPPGGQGPRGPPPGPWRPALGPAPPAMRPPAGPPPP